MKNLYIARSPMVAARQLGLEMVDNVRHGFDAVYTERGGFANLKSATAPRLSGRSSKAKVCAEFDVDPEVALADAERLVSELADRGLLLLTNGPAKPSPAETERGL